jgi:hypothetical protein
MVKATSSAVTEHRLACTCWTRMLDQDPNGAAASQLTSQRYQLAWAK